MRDMISPGSPFDKKAGGQGLQMIEDDFPEVGDDAFFSDVVQVIVRRGEQHLQQEQQGDGQRHLIEQVDILVDLDHVDQILHEQGNQQIDRRDQYQEKTSPNHGGSIRNQ